MSRNSSVRSYRRSYFRNENPSDNSSSEDDIDNYEWFEMLTKKFINKKFNILNEKSEQLLKS